MTPMARLPPPSRIAIPVLFSVGQLEVGVPSSKPRASRCVYQGVRAFKGGRVSRIPPSSFFGSLALIRPDTPFITQTVLGCPFATCGAAFLGLSHSQLRVIRDPVNHNTQGPASARPHEGAVPGHRPCLPAAPFLAPRPWSLTKL